MTDPDPTAGDRELATDLGWDLTALYERAGRGWSRLTSDDTGLPLSDRNWYVAGEPPQVMLGVAKGPEPVVVARPRGVWTSWRLALEPEQPHRPAHVPEELSGLLAEVATSRRRSFRWCRYCRSLAAPEHRTEPDVCSGCAQIVQGVVF